MYPHITKQDDICVSFHTKKILSVGRGGAILTSSLKRANWYKQMRFDGRHEGIPVSKDQPEVIGHHCLMTPDVAASALMRLNLLPEKNEDLTDMDPDLSKLEIFDEYSIR